MKNNLVIGLLGHRNSGKSTTWYELFGDRVRTGINIRRLYLTVTEYIEVFLVVVVQKKERLMSET